MTAGGSAARKARALRARARRGVWRRVLAWMGLSAAARRADAQAAMWDHGARGEKATAVMLRVLEAEGWHVLHDLRLPRSGANLDHVLVSPCGTGVVVLDTKAWDRTRTTQLVRGRVCCGFEDRHKQLEHLAGYVQRAGVAIGRRGVNVLPAVVVHGSPVAGGLFAATVAGHPMWILGTGALVQALRDSAARNPRDPARAGVLARHVAAVLRPYGG